MIKYLILILLILYASANTQDRTGGGQIRGRILDANSSHPVEYANIVVFKENDSTQITGSVSDPDGNFLIDKIPPGKYYVDVLFMGYERERLTGIQINRSSLSVDLQDILIEPASISLGDVVIEQDRPSLTYQIDKKVINVNQFSATISGTAAEVLENIPSVTVDIDGNVSLRGSSNFTVLIDGRPTIIDPQDVLQQIPASTIENIEIITNPSAKYNPEGTAGIINIILKRNRNSGLSGILNANAGLKEKYGGDFLFEYKTPVLSTNFGLDYNDRSFPGTDNSLNRYDNETGSTSISSAGSTIRGRKSLSLRGGIEFNAGSNSFITLGGRFNDRKMNREALLFYDRWTDTTDIHSFSQNSSYTERNGTSFSLNTGYLKRFETRGHELSADIVYSSRESDELTFSETTANQNILSGRQTTEEGPSSEVNARMDYILPIGESSRIETGYQGEIDVADEITSFSDYDIQTGTYSFQPEYSHNVRFEENEHSVYSIFASEIKSFGYQLGLRGEYTKRIITMRNIGEEFKIDQWDYFPTVHGSYKFSEGQQIMASYTRRINRPGGWALEPFITWFDENTVRQGNPSLLPEFIDSYEIGGQTVLGKVSMSAEVYYLRTVNKIEGVRSVYPEREDVTLQTFSNVGKDHSLGTELMVNLSPAEFWDVNLMGNVYDYRIEGMLYNQPFSRNSFNWRGRINNVFKIGSSTQVQLNFMYNSPSVSSQGRREEYISSDAAIRQDFLDKKLSLIFQVRDIFGSSFHEFTSEGPDFYSYVSMKRESPIVMLSLRLNINSFKNERKNQRDENGFMEGEEL